MAIEAACLLYINSVHLYICYIYIYKCLFFVYLCVKFIQEGDEIIAVNLTPNKTLFTLFVESDCLDVCPLTSGLQVV